MERKQRRASAERGSVTVEYVIILGLLVAPFALVCIALGRDLIPFYECVEILNGFPIP
jgi:hypothetical protein